MSDQSKKRNEDPWDYEAPGKRLAKKTRPELTPAQAKKKKEKIIMIVMIVAAVVMVLAAAVVLLYNRWVKKPSLPPGPAPGVSAAPGESGRPDADPDPEATLNFDAVQPKVGGDRRSEDIYTILIFGSDTTSGLTDTMMVATYDVTNQQATVMSIPRDTLINSSARGGIAVKKMNAVYNLYGKGDRGVEAMKAEVSELVGFTPDYYVRIDWELVGEMVDAIGGVWFDNPFHMEYYDPYQNLNIYQEQGYRKINGSDAMQIVRWRKNNPGVSSKGGTGSDIDRLQVQHTFLKAVLKQTLQIGNITRIGQLIDLFNSRVESDLDLENMFWFAKSAVVGGLQVEDVEFCTMPYGYGNYGGAGGDFVYPIQSELLAMINRSLNPFQEQVTIRQLDLMTPAGDGSIRSSTGRLADPSLGYPPVVETDEPEESGDPDASEDPDASDNPDESGAPNESGEPAGSGPVATDPAASAPVPADPASGEPGPAVSGPPAPVETMPAWLRPPGTAESDPHAQPEADPAQNQGGGTADVTDWGDTPD